MKYLSLILLVGMLFSLIGFTKKRLKLRNFGLNVVAFVFIYIATLAFGPAKYSVDLEQSPIKINNKSYLLVWSINRALPFESLAYPRVIRTSSTHSGENAVYAIPDEIKATLKDNYQSEGVVTQYLVYYLLFAWFFIYRRYFKRKKSSSNTLDTKQEPSPDKESNSTKRGKPTINDVLTCPSLVRLEQYKDQIESVRFYRFLYKKKALAAYDLRKTSLIPELTSAFYALAKNRFNRANSPEAKRPSAFLPLWVASMMRHGVFDFAIDVSVHAAGDYPKLNNKIKNLKAINFAKDYWIDSATSTSRSNLLEAKIRDSIEKSLLAIIPTGLVTFSQQSKTRLKFYINAVDFEYQEDDVSNQYAFNNKDGVKAIISPAYRASMSVEGAAINPSLKNAPLSYPQLNEMIEQFLAKNGEISGRATIDGKPAYVHEFMKAKVVTSLVNMVMGAPVSAQKQTQITQATEIKDTDDFYAKLADEIKDAVQGEATDEALGLAVDYLLSEHADTVATLTDNILSSVAELDIQNEILNELVVGALEQIAMAAANSVSES
ncbi:hypothetical protein [Vibrio sp. MA40-2]|uniref:hypothetical protein n=1 Tax=Vibrio sp. MA40-2 TaxID=3391828 RepID=UPI0039A5FCD4